MSYFFNYLYSTESQYGLRKKEGKNSSQRTNKSVFAKMEKCDYSTTSIMQIVLHLQLIKITNNFSTYIKHLFNSFICVLKFYTLIFFNIRIQNKIF